MITPFAAGVPSSAQLFDSARTSVRELWRAAAGRPDLSQDEVVALLAGPSQSHPDGQRVRQELADRMRSVHGWSAPGFARHPAGPGRGLE